MRALSCACVLLAVGTVVASRTDYLSVKRKFDQIERKQVRSGTRVPITAGELNAYVQTELPRYAPQGFRNPTVELQGGNTATGRALIDFVRLRSAQGKPPNWLLRQLLEGEHEVAVTAAVRSANGSAVVDVKRVEVAGVPISGAALDFLIRNYLIPNYPNAAIGRPIQLGYRINRLEVHPGVAYVVMQ